MNTSNFSVQNASQRWAGRILKQDLAPQRFPSELVCDLICFSRHLRNNMHDIPGLHIEIREYLGDTRQIWELDDPSARWRCVKLYSAAEAPRVEYRGNAIAATREGASVIRVNMDAVPRAPRQPVQ